jgi:hypothetical protein
MEINNNVSKDKTLKHSINDKRANSQRYIRTIPRYQRCLTITKPPYKITVCPFTFHFLRSRSKYPKISRKQSTISPRERQNRNGLRGILPESITSNSKDPPFSACPVASLSSTSKELLLSSHVWVPGSSSIKFPDEFSLLNATIISSTTGTLSSSVHE